MVNCKQQSFYCKDGREITIEKLATIVQTSKRHGIIIGSLVDFQENTNHYCNSLYKNSNYIQQYS